MSHCPGKTKSGVNPPSQLHLARVLSPAFRRHSDGVVKNPVATAPGSDIDPASRTRSVVKDRRPAATRPFDILYHLLDQEGSPLSARNGGGGDREAVSLWRPDGTASHLVNSSRDEPIRFPVAEKTRARIDDGIALNGRTGLERTSNHLKKRRRASLLSATPTQTPKHPKAGVKIKVRLTQGPNS
jgi:hypothetical protein